MPFKLNLMNKQLFCCLSIFHHFVQ